MAKSRLRFQKRDELNAVITELEQVKITPTIKQGRRHIKVRWQAPDGLVRTYIVSNSGGSRASPMLARLGVRRLLRQDGLIAARTPLRGSESSASGSENER
jgi:hypothetical protein